MAAAPLRLPLPLRTQGPYPRARPRARAARCRNLPRVAGRELMQASTPRFSGNGSINGGIVGPDGEGGILLPSLAPLLLAIQQARVYNDSKAAV
jgi:hypothetical protein